MRTHLKQWLGFFIELEPAMNATTVQRERMNHALPRKETTTAWTTKECLTYECAQKRSETRYEANSNYGHSDVVRHGVTEQNTESEYKRSKDETGKTYAIPPPICFPLVCVLFHKA